LRAPAAEPEEPAAEPEAAEPEATGATGSGDPES